MHLFNNNISTEALVKTCCTSLLTLATLFCLIHNTIAEQIYTAAKFAELSDLCITKSNSEDQRPQMTPPFLHDHTFLEGLRKLFISYGSSSFVSTAQKNQEIISSLYQQVNSGSIDENEKIKLCKLFRKSTIEFHRKTQFEFEQNPPLREAVSEYQTSYCLAVHERRIVVKHDFIFNQLLSTISDKSIINKLTLHRNNLLSYLKLIDNTDSKLESRELFNQLTFERNALETIFDQLVLSDAGFANTIHSIIQKNISKISPFERDKIERASHASYSTRFDRKLSLNC
ncbi:MAG: hypothetical protein QM538_02745 [Methylacidiphilales bacterium]|nr:hypothetical protein [Candidatus Methylacidiphilales bacterium]